MWQAIVVGLIVAVAVLYAGWAMLPAQGRLRLAQSFAAWAQRPGRPGWLGRAAAAIEKAARARLGGCSNCSAVQAAPGKPTDRGKP
jgi:antibiotic biosynthesis monooxygenase (ABM) superfamily enzyme